MIRSNKAETAFHGSHRQGDKAVCILKVLARPWIGVRVSLVFLYSRTGERRGRKRIERENAQGIRSELKLRATVRERENSK